MNHISKQYIVTEIKTTFFCVKFINNGCSKCEEKLLFIKLKNVNVT